MAAATDTSTPDVPRTEAPDTVSTSPRLLHLGQPVVATDGPFGELADIIIDPQTNEITHLIVEPHHQHLQSRLVPLWLTQLDAGTINVALDLRHLSELARCSFSQLVTIGVPIDLGDQWDTADLTIRALPYWSAIAPEGWNPVDADAQYDRIPKGEIEVRRQSVVQTSDGHSVGHVEGMVVDAEHMVAVVVASGVPGLRHHVVVPVTSVDLVGADEIFLNIERDEFHDLPDTAGLRPPTTGAAYQRVGATKRKVSTAASKMSSYARHLLGRFTNR